MVKTQQEQEEQDKIDKLNKKSKKKEKKELKKAKKKEKAESKNKIRQKELEDIYAGYGIKKIEEQKQNVQYKDDGEDS